MTRLSPRSTTRRRVLEGLGLAGAAGLAGAPALVRAAEAGMAGGDPRADWAWLVGSWNVSNRRLKARLAGSTDWEAFPGKSALWRTMDGLGTIDDNAFIRPDGVYRAMGIRGFDPQTRRWAIWWLDGRSPAALDPPVRGGFSGDEGTFVGEDDTLRGRPVQVRFHWADIHGPAPHWAQSFSPDGGRSWETNFENIFTRVSAEPAPVPRLPGEPANAAPADWAFLAGHWDVSHRRLRKRLAGSGDWDEFDGELVNWPVMGGAANVGDNIMRLPGGTVRGVGFRAYDPARKLWSSWWLDARYPTEIGAPLTGRFEGGVGVFESPDTLDGRPILSRVRWSGITADTARWEQSASADGGATWEVNWVSDFRRRRA
jgi:hypothetical protein